MSAFQKADGSVSRSRAFSWGTKAIALTATGLLLASCASGEAESSSAGGPVVDLTLNIGTVLPQTGTLAFLGPPEEAGVALAVKDINDADLGITVDVTYGDSGDTTNNAWETTVPTLIDAGNTVLVGAAASGVTKLFLDQAVSAGVLTFSPANTSPDFTDWADDNLFWRTAPSDLLQGSVSGNLMADDGVQTLGQLVLNDAYGTGLAAATKDAFEAAGGEVVAAPLFNSGDTSFDSQIAELLAANPDAIQIIAFDETKTIVPLLASFDPSKLYLVDGNTADYSADFAPGTLEGAQGTLPGPALSDDFKTRLNDNWVAEGHEELTDFSYAGESYDAVVLSALAALAAGSTDGAAIASKLQEVSGGTGDGVKVTTFAEGAQAILDGQIIDYDGPSGPITFDENGDPTEATIGIYKFDADNVPVRTN